MDCPVCQTTVEENAKFCPHCERKFRRFLSITEDEKALYQVEQEEARKAWQVKQLDDLPRFKRDVFETRKEFKERIEKDNPYVAGKAELLEKLYDVENSIYPLTVKWDVLLDVFVPETAGLYIHAECEAARKFSQGEKKHPVEVILNVPDISNEQIKITGMSLKMPEQVLPIKQHECIWNLAKPPVEHDNWSYKLALSLASAEKNCSDPQKQPVFQRGMYETKAAFRERIANQGEPYLARTAVLLKNEYDIDRQIFPVQVTLADWLKPFHLPVEGLYIQADRDFAKQLYQAGEEHPVYVCLAVENDAIAVTAFDLYGLCGMGGFILLRQHNEEKAWQEACQTNSISSYELYLNSYGNTHRKSWLGRYCRKALHYIKITGAIEYQKKVEADEKAWTEACKINTQKSYQEYLDCSVALKKNPTQGHADGFSKTVLGKYTAQAKAEIEKIVQKKIQNNINEYQKQVEADEKAWAKACKINTQKSYQDYLSWAVALKKNSRQGYTDYFGKNALGEYSNQAKAKIEKIIQEKIQEDTEQDEYAWEIACRENTSTSYRKYIDSSDSRSIKKHLSTAIELEKQQKAIELEEIQEVIVDIINAFKKTKS